MFIFPRFIDESSRSVVDMKDFAQKDFLFCKHMLFNISLYHIDIFLSSL